MPKTEFHTHWFIYGGSPKNNIDWCNINPAPPLLISRTHGTNNQNYVNNIPPTTKIMSITPQQWQNNCQSFAHQRPKRCPLSWPTTKNLLITLTNNKTLPVSPPKNLSITPQHQQRICHSPLYQQPKFVKPTPPQQQKLSCFSYHTTNPSQVNNYPQTPLKLHDQCNFCCPANKEVTLASS